MTLLLALEAVERGESSLSDKIVVSPDAGGHWRIPSLAEGR